MNWAVKLIKKIRATVDKKEELEELKIVKMLFVDDLVLAVLTKNKEFEDMRDNGSDPSYVIPREARAFRELVQAVKEVKK